MDINSEAYQELKTYSNSQSKQYTQCTTCFEQISLKITTDCSSLSRKILYDIVSRYDQAIFIKKIYNWNFAIMLSKFIHYPWSILLEIPSDFLKNEEVAPEELLALEKFCNNIFTTINPNLELNPLHANSWWKTFLKYGDKLDNMNYLLNRLQKQNIIWRPMYV